MATLNNQQIEDLNAAIQANVTEWNRLNDLNTKLGTQKTAISAKIDAKVAANVILRDALATEVKNLLVNYAAFTDDAAPTAWTDVSDAAP